MFRLYQRDETGQIQAYHEVWVEPEHRRIIEHWGPVGEQGETRAHRIKLLGSLESQIDGILAAPRAAGFSEPVETAFRKLKIEYPVGRVGYPSEDRQRQALEDRLNEILGWTGLGYCDGGTIEPNSVEAICYVVDVQKARELLAEALQDSDFGSYSRFIED